MSFAIVQKELVAPDVDRLTRAFCVLPDLTSIDAQNAASDAYGILWRGLDAERAGALQAALTHEGLETELVSEAEFPKLANAHVIRQVQFTPEHLVVVDPMQRVTRIPWNDVLLLAAGRIHDRSMRRPRPTEEAESEEEASRLVIDLFLTDRSTRFSIAAEEFNFDHLGQRLSDDFLINYLFLVQELAEHLPDASLNQGAFLGSQKPPEHFTYPSKHAYQEELIWLLWKIGKLVAD